MIRALCAFLLALLVSCAAGAPASVPRADGVGSVVALLRLEPAEPDVSSEDAPPRLKDRYEPACSAFAVRGLNQLPGLWLVTAQHCAFSARIRYVPPSGWGHSFASVEYTDVATDLALLQPDNPRELVPYWVAAPPPVGESVRSVSAVFSGATAGRMGPWLSGRFYETSQTIERGWSGAPVLDSHGHVFALVSQCPFDGVKCVPRHAIVSVLP